MVDFLFVVWEPGNDVTSKKNRDKKETSTSIRYKYELWEALSKTDNWIQSVY